MKNLRLRLALALFVSGDMYPVMRIAKKVLKMPRFQVTLSKEFGSRFALALFVKGNTYPVMRIKKKQCLKYSAFKSLYRKI